MLAAGTAAQGVIKHSVASKRTAERAMDAEHRVHPRLMCANGAVGDVGSALRIDASLSMLRTNQTGLER
jgi:hypothetical protein